MSEKIKDYTARRGQAKGSITRIASFVENLSKDTKTDEASSRLELLERAFNDFKEADSKLIALECASEMVDIEGKYLNLKVNLNEYISSHTASVSVLEQFNQIMSKTTAQQNEFLANFTNTLSASLNQSFLNQSSEEPHFTARLPRIQVPTFDGSYKEFQSFKDLFTASVHNKSYLSDAEKFQYLRGCLKGESAELIKHFPISDANYRAAWSKICDRYDKRKIAISDFIQTFLDMQPLREKSAKKLRNLHNVADQVVRGLQALGSEAESRDHWLLHILLRKTDVDTQQAWAFSSVNKDNPTFDEFLKFINNRCDGLEPCETVKPNVTKLSLPRSHNIVSERANPIVEPTRCPLCNDPHQLYECNKFLDLDASLRISEVRKLNVCFNCLSTTHRVNRCRARRSCKKCGRRHHSTLHDGIISNANSSYSTPSATNVASNYKVSEANQSSTVQTNSQPKPIAKANLACTDYAILPTAVVDVADCIGRLHQCNVLLDSGSQISFITESCLRRLQLRRQRASIIVGGLATSNMSTNGKTNIEIYSRYDDSVKLKLKVFILTNITTTSEYKRNGIQDIEKFDELELADPKYLQKKNIDILIGADQFFNILKHNRISISNNSITAYETTLGWIISGQPRSTRDETYTKLISMNVKIMENTSLENAIKKFWEQEEIPTIKIQSEDERECEELFTKTTRRDKTGRFIVQLPFKSDMKKLGDTYMAAQCRLFTMERKIRLNPIFGKMYHDFMQEYSSMGHMVKLSPNELRTYQDEVCYLPHHGVWKHSSETTKLRVVFDGSCVSSSGISLNDKLRIGPTVQPTLWTILLRFRTFSVAVSADVEKMYRQILVEPNQTKYQRILWRESTDKPIDHYELRTVTYGTSSASFLSTRVLLQIADENEVHFPKVARAIRQNFYVDDVLTGASNEAEAAQLKHDLTAVLQGGGLPLRKWRSNLQTLTDFNESVPISQEGNNMSQTLGLLWDPIQDIFRFKINIPDEDACTKRSILSIMSRLFDPLGWLSPFVINMKLLLQDLWLAKVTWDEQLPDSLQDRWRSIKSQLDEIKFIKIPRHIYISSNDIKIELHGFSDASELAYAACVYVRITSSENVVSNLLTSKSKVAPIQPVSLPRLELCGAHLLAKLISSVCEAYEYQNVPIFLWTDSTVVLSWLHSGPPKKWKAYVTNRTAEIQNLVPTAAWRHVSGTDNPADLATRGIKSSKLISNDLWWMGPKWIYTNSLPWPRIITIKETDEERRTRFIGLQLNVQEDDNVIDNVVNDVSKWPKIIRIIAFIRRFLYNARNPKNQQAGWLTGAELNDAEIVTIKHIQQTEFHTEIKLLRSTKGLKSNSRLLALSPFIDENGLLRVGGRLENSTCSYETKHPIILPKNHKISIAILNYLHKKHFHPGPSLLISLSRMKYWIIGVCHTARSLCHKCVRCFRFANLKSSQLMGNLPYQRVVPARPFSNTGVDYAGPIMLASKRGRGSKLVKGYIVIFICFCTKAVHIEVASDMSTATFIGVLRRFVSRRGVPTEIFSDNGSNFRGAKSLISDIYRLLESSECQAVVSEYAADNRIKWSFIPPHAPNFGGIWERAVRSVKTHLIRVIGNSHLTFEEMSTVLAQIESILNSRPLCAIGNEDPGCIDALTPAHFLIMGSNAHIPDENHLNTPQSRSTRWQQVQQIVQSYWKRYSRDYLHTLQQRTKSKLKQHNLEVNNLVIIKDDNNPPGYWPLGRVVEVYPGKDGHVRVATVRTKYSTFKRPISKLFRLPIEDEINTSDSRITETSVKTQS